MKTRLLCLGFIVLCYVVFGQPYPGSPVNLPGVVEAENYDLGGQGTAYNDTTSGNISGEYRSDDVDIESGSTGYHISYITSGEWLNYTVNPQAGNYYIDIYSASAAGEFNHSIGIHMDGIPVIDSVSLPTNGSWTEYAVTTVGPVALIGGQYVMTIRMRGSDFNLDRFEFRTTSDIPTPTPDPTPTPTPSPPPAPPLPPLHIDGNSIVDEAGQAFEIRGIGTADIDMLVKGGRENPVNFPDMYPMTLEENLDLVRDWDGVNLIRLCIHSFEDDWEIGGVGWETWSDKEAFAVEVMDRAVNHVINMGLYVMIDWHYYVGRDWSNETAIAEFWYKIAPRYADHPNIIYEIFNEPGGGNWGSLGDAVTTDFIDFAEKLTNAIRSGNWSEFGWENTTGAGNIVLVGCPSWSSQPPNAHNPSASYNADLFLTAPNVGYVVHIYPGHGIPRWIEYTQRFRPVVLTEFGWELNGTIPTGGTTSGWGQPFKNYIDSFGNVGVVAWCLDNLYRSIMYSTGSRSRNIPWELLGSDANIPPKCIAYGGAPNTYDNYMGQFVKDWYAEGPPAPTPVWGTPTPEPPGQLGDVNLDNIIDIKDALLIAQYYVKIPVEGVFVEENADVDCNGSISIVDALLIARYYVDLITGFCE